MIWINTKGRSVSFDEIVDRPDTEVAGLSVRWGKRTDTGRWEMISHKFTTEKVSVVQLKRSLQLSHSQLL